jgi:hypothetical protein
MYGDSVGSFSLRVSCPSFFFFFNLYISQLICTHLNYLISMVCHLCKHLMYKGLTTIFWRGLHRVTWTPRMNLHIFTHMIGYYLYLKNMRCFSTVKMREGVNIVISTNTFLDLICCKVINPGH